MNKTFTTLLAVLVLLVVGIYLFNQKNKEPQEPTTIYTETVVDESGEEVEINLDRPLTESFSNAVSNNTSDKPQTVAVHTPTTYPVVEYVAETLARPFILGFYYFDTINKKGIDRCKPKINQTEKEKEKFPKYDEDNFILENVLIEDKKYICM